MSFHSIISNIKFVFVVLLIVFALGACTTNNRNTSDSNPLEQKLSTLTTGQQFSLGTIKSGNWNAFCVVTPYYSIDSLLNLNIMIDKNTQKELKQLVMFDNINTLLFIKNDTVIAFDPISRSILDFSMINNTSKFFFSPLDIFKINENRTIEYYPIK